ncbi:hypothetical protein K1I41_12005 [Flavobacterium litorale]|uniref:Uncharacterized protein n=1 Tax=Flavobacterium litorale TaxID=2856519 RepID=A0ABX8VAK5_9FLAO|nr:hypothetical protein [Flavobacterium litorale]QYJ68233.1 hypothetical protein K1I41_12005 [Flavobacterium litorale]
MALNQTWCYRCVGKISNMIKYGKTRSGNQIYICKLYRKTRVENYAYQAYKPDIDKSNLVAPDDHDTYGLELHTHYFHPDHLGSSSYITNGSAEITQHME